jgi:hypothetical protein
MPTTPHQEANMTRTPPAHHRFIPASPRQLNYLRTLAIRTGQTFTPPTSMYDAGVQINRLKRTPASSRLELALERRDLAADNAARERNCDVPVTPRELTGYGSRATWSGRS